MFGENMNTRFTAEREKYYREVAGDGGYCNMSSQDIDALLSEIDAIRNECKVIKSAAVEAIEEQTRLIRKMSELKEWTEKMHKEFCRRAIL